MKKFLILNGPNLNLLGMRQPEIYGHLSLDNVSQELLEYAAHQGYELGFYQSNSEGGLIDAVQEADFIFDGIIFNPGAYSHYSYALADAVYAINIPVIEVHLTDITKREPFRATSVIAPACAGQFMGKHLYSYKEALDFLDSIAEDAKGEIENACDVELKSDSDSTKDAEGGANE